MKKIVLYGKFTDSMLECLQKKCPPGFETKIVKSEDLDSISDCDYMICRAVPINSDTFVNAKKISFLQKWGVGFDKIDIKSVGQIGIPVSVCVGGNSEPVAELTVALILAVLRNIVPMDSDLRNGNWDRETYSNRNYLLNGKKVGLIGIGNIAKKVAKILIGGFDCDVTYYDIFRLPSVVENSLGLKYSDLDSLLKNSDIVSVHVPLVDSTKKMINSQKISLMKESSFLINTSRGGVIDEQSLISALENNKILGAGLDTFENEPLDKDSPLLSLKNVVITPHSGGNTVDNDINMASICMDNIELFDKSKDFNMKSIVNKDFLKK